jgi:curved DNA-binding protein CbpA
VDLYEILGVERTATPEEIKFAYRAKAKRLHPDAGGNASDFELLAWANRILSNPKKREDYDRSGRLDDRNEDSKISEAWTAIGSILNMQLQNVPDLTNVDLVALMQSAIQHASLQTATQLQNVETRIARVKDAQRRFHTSTGENRIARMLEVEISNLERQANGMRDALATGKLAGEILQSYSYEHTNYTHMMVSGMSVFGLR